MAKTGRKTYRIIGKLFCAGALFLCGVLLLSCYRNGLFTSVESAREFAARAGCFGWLLFIWLQVMQVLVPVLPGAVNCIGGVVLFGAWRGFLYNYIGVCLGSFAAFAVARYSGKSFLTRLIPEKVFRKYETWMEGGNRFAKLFAAAIFLPFAPDDILCYLAGTTAMSWKQFITIILLGKPFAAAMYCFGLTTVFQNF